MKTRHTTPSQVKSYAWQMLGQLDPSTLSKQATSLSLIHNINSTPTFLLNTPTDQRPFHGSAGLQKE